MEKPLATLTNLSVLLFLLLGLSYCTKKNNIISPPSRGNSAIINVSLLSGGGSVTHLRGLSSPGKNGFLDNAQNGTQLRQLMDVCSSGGYNLINGYRSMYDDVNYDEFKESGNSYAIRQEPLYTTMRNYAKAKGFTQVCQISGHNVATGFGFDTAYENVGDAGYFPLPEQGQNTVLLQNAFSGWAIQSDSTVGVQSIWIGAQEPTHTLGFLNGIKNDDGLRTNIRRYISYWKPIAQQIRAGGSKVGGIQLNSANSDLYSYAIQAMKDSSLSLDYLTFQMYQWGDTSDLNAAMAALDSYRQKYPDAKILVNRGNWDKIVPGGADGSTTSIGMIIFLQGEKVLVDNPGKFFGYTLDKTANGFSDQTLEYKTVQWLNQNLFLTQRVLTDLPAGVSGFITSDGQSKVSAVLWNLSDSSYDLSLKIKDGNISSSPLINAFKASGSDLNTVSLAWDNAAKQVNGISLGKNEYMLIKVY
ncbi:MAG: hypothetical protein JSU05_00065 [Bacteroidetes bacterium]|nr:hypothetical protein [Bacteroidota bacterium]